MRKGVESNLNEIKEKEQKQRMREIHAMMRDKWGLDVPFEAWYADTEKLKEESYQEFKDFWFGVLMLLLVSCGVSQGLFGDYTHGLMPVIIYILNKVCIE